MISEKTIIDAYVRIRTIDQTIPDDVLDFMKDASINQLNELNKVSQEIPQLDYWMLNIITEALQKEYDKRSKDSNISFALGKLAEEKGFNVAKKEKEDIDSNRFHSLGQVACTIKRIDEIKESITLLQKLIKNK